jgi:hypothetical protein
MYSKVELKECLSMKRVEDNANFGIPEGEKGASATDGISQVVDAITSNLEEEVTGEVDAEKAKRTSK